MTTTTKLLLLNLILLIFQNNVVVITSLISSSNSRPPPKRTKTPKRQQRQQQQIMPLYDLWGYKNLDIEIPKDIFPSEQWMKEQDELFGLPEHGYIESTYENKKLHYRKNLPPKDKGPIKAIVVWQHGICGQSGFGMKCDNGKRLTDHALRIQMMNNQGIAVYAMDQLGHGFSEGTRFYIPNGKYQINRDDLIKFVQFAANDNQQDQHNNNSSSDDDSDSDSIPIFVSGDSYGGCIAVHVTYQLQTSPNLAPPKGFMGCTLSCPAIHADLPPKLMIWFLRYGLAPFFPKWTPFFMPHPITSERIWKLQEPRDYFSNPNNMHDLSRGGVPFCLGTALGCLTALIDVQNFMSNFNMPFHINHGTSDYGVPISGSQFMYDTSKTQNELKSFNSIEDGYHALYSQLDAEESLNHEIDWIFELIQKKKHGEEAEKLPN